VVRGLKPVDYIRKNNMSGKREAGFIAQDVEQLFKELGIENEGLLSSGYDGSLELRYNDFIPILTKAIQEQQQQIESYKSENDNLKSQLQILQEEVEQIKSTLAGTDDSKIDR
jgi:flagellar biosynthesis chaperone FliJ